MMVDKVQQLNIVEEQVVAAPVTRRTAISGSWMLGGRLASRLLDLVTMLILARVLLPADFGLVAIAASLVAIVETSLDLPISQALVRLPVIEAASYDTAFTLSILRGAALTLILWLVSFPFAKFYKDSRIFPLIVVLGFAPAARGLLSPRLASFSKQLDFSRDFITEFSGKVAALSLALTFAFLYKSYWAIAVGTVASPLVATLVSYVIAPYRPRLSLARLSEFSGFLGWTTAAQVISAVTWQMDRLLLGKLTSKSTLGFFTTTNDMAGIPLATVFTPILRPLLSAFTVIRDDPKRLARSYQTSSNAMLTLALPILVGEAMVAEPAVTLVFGQKWLAAVPMFRWIAISLIPAVFAVPFGPLVMSLDQPRYFFKRNTFELFVKVPLVIVGAIKFQFYGVIFARLISEASTILFCMLIVRKLLGLSLPAQVLVSWRTAAGIASMMAGVALCTHRLTGVQNTLPLAIGLFSTVLVGIVCYCGSLLALWNWQGRPDGIESLVISNLNGVLRRAR